MNGTQTSSHRGLIAVTGVVALVIGFIIAKLGILGGSISPKVTTVAPGPTSAVISVLDATTNTCEQTVGGVVDALPVLSRSAATDTISWGGTTASTKVTVTFAASGSNGPFGSATIQPGQSSGRVTGHPNVYAFQQVIINSGTAQVTCSNPQSMGVHIDQ